MQMQTFADALSQLAYSVIGLTHMLTEVTNSNDATLN